MNNNTIKFNKAGFNSDFASKKTEEEFIAHFAPQFFLNLKRSERESVLKEAYRLCCKKMGVEPRGFAYQPLPIETPSETLTDKSEEAQEEEARQRMMSNLT